MVLSDVGKGDLLGRVAIIPKDNYYVLNQRVALIRPKNKQQTNYLFSYINSHQRYFKLHGAGMSQNGAKCLANKGYSAEQILNYYYNDIELRFE